MRHTPALRWLVLVLLVLAVLVLVVTRPLPLWDGRVGQLAPPRPRRNPARHARRQAYRRVRWLRRPTGRAALRAARRQQRTRLLRCLRRRAAAAPAAAYQPAAMTRVLLGGGQPPRPRDHQLALAPAAPPAPDPLADLRQRRGWVDQVPERQLWADLIQVRWPAGPVCPHCGERDPRYVQGFDPAYRGGLGRWRCQVCAEAGDPGAGGTFTPLTGTILDGMRPRSACAPCGCCWRPLPRVRPASKRPMKPGSTG